MPKFIYEFNFKTDYEPYRFKGEWRAISETDLDVVGYGPTEEVACDRAFGHLLRKHADMKLEGYATSGTHTDEKKLKLHIDEE